MRQLVATVLIWALALPTAAVADTRRPLFTTSQNAFYVGGTVPDLKEFTTGRLRTDGETDLVFEHGGGRVLIPYQSIVSYKYTEELARRLGVVLTVAVVMLKRRQRRHIIEVTYKGQTDKTQVAIFEVPKDRALTMVAVLKTRATQACNTRDFRPCKEELKPTSKQESPEWPLRGAREEKSPPGRRAFVSYDAAFAGLVFYAVHEGAELA